MKNGLARVLRLRHSCGWLATVLLMLPVLRWVWFAAGDPLRSLFHVRSELLPSLCSGRLLMEPFDIRHAGSCFDQPTIGKWLFLFTFMAVTSLPWALAVRWLSDRRKAGAYLAYALCCTVLGVFLLSLLTWPLVWLAQYVCSMGVTPRRVQGLEYGATGGLAVMTFIVSAFVKPPRFQETGVRQVCAAGGAVAAVILATLGGLFMWVNGPAWLGRLYCLRCVNHPKVARACGALMANTLITNAWGSVSYGPKSAKWRELPSELRLWNLRELCVGTNHVALVMEDRVNRLVFLENRTNAGLYELTFMNGRCRSVLARTNLPAGGEDAAPPGSRDGRWNRSAAPAGGEGAAPPGHRDGRWNRSAVPAGGEDAAPPGLRDGRWNRSAMPAGGEDAAPPGHRDGR